MGNKKKMAKALFPLMMATEKLIVNRDGCSGNLEMEDDNIRMMQDLTGLEILAKVKNGDTDLGVQPF